MSITIYMTINARHDDEDVCRKHNDDETMGTVRPAGQIRRCQHYIVGHMGVGDEGRQGRVIGRESWGSFAYTTHRGVGVTEFFLTTRCACLQA